MNCPKCQNAALKVVEFKGYPTKVEYCPQCRGVFLDDRELHRFVSDRSRLARFESSGLDGLVRTKWNCPKCKTSLFTGKIPDFEFQAEHCPKCRGLWLDHGELHSVIQRAATSEKPEVQDKAEPPRLKPLEHAPQAFAEVADSDEEFYWAGTPLTAPFLARGIPVLALGLVWGVLDFGLLRLIAEDPHSQKGSMPVEFAVPFFLLHLAPLWLGVGNMIRLFLVRANTSYAVTSKRLMIRTGFFGTDFKSIDYQQLSDLAVDVNPAEKLYECGTIHPSTSSTREYVHPKSFAALLTLLTPVGKSFIAIKDPYRVFQLIKELSVHVKTDWQYPNALRPSENPGYWTRLKKSG